MVPEDLPQVWVPSSFIGAGAAVLRGVGVHCVTGRIWSLDMNFSVQLSEKTFGPNRVHVPKDFESGVQRDEFFRNPTAEKASASTLPSSLFEAFEVDARGTDKTGMPMEPAHKRVPTRARGEKMPTKVVRLCRTNQGNASVQDILEPRWLRTPWHISACRLETFRWKCQK